MTTSMMRAVLCLSAAIQGSMLGGCDDPEKPGAEPLDAAEDLQMEKEAAEYEVSGDEAPGVREDEAQGPASSANDELTASSSGPEEQTSAVKVESKCGGKTGVYCVTVQLKGGAQLKPYMTEGPLAMGGTNECRGWSNQFTEKTVKQFTTYDKSYDGYNIKNAQVIVSGSYSNDKGKPAFPMKVKSGGWIATYGYECTHTGGVDDLAILQIRNAQGRAFIEPFNLTNFNKTSSAPEAIVGLAAKFDKGDANSYKGRNFVGLMNPYNGGYGTVVFVVAANSPGIKSSTAIDILKDKGCPESQIMQLDGSTVAQLSDRTSGTWQHLVTSDGRDMTQAFGIFAP